MTVSLLTLQLAMIGIDDAIIRIAAGIDTPIALAGLFAAIVFLVFRLILTGGFIPQLSQAGGQNVMMRIITVLFILALVTACLGFAGYVIRNWYPTLSEAYVDVGTDEDRPLEDIVNAVKAGRNVTIEFMNCSPAVKSATVEKGNHDGVDIKDLLEKLRQRVRGPQPEYRVEKKGESRYEIICP
jgi:hypothetical protein